MTATPAPSSAPRWGAWLFALLCVAGVLDAFTGWVEPVFDALAHQFYEIPQLAAVRRPGQLALVRAHAALLALAVSIGLMVTPRLDRHWRWWWAVFVTAYALRAAIWTAGGNLPLVPGDSSHYVEVATSAVSRASMAISCATAVFGTHWPKYVLRHSM